MRHISFCSRHWGLRLLRGCLHDPSSPLKLPLLPPRTPDLEICSLWGKAASSLVHSPQALGDSSLFFYSVGMWPRLLPLLKHAQGSQLQNVFGLASNLPCAGSEKSLPPLPRNTIQISDLKWEVWRQGLGLQLHKAANRDEPGVAVISFSLLTLTCSPMAFLFLDRICQDLWMDACWPSHISLSGFSRYLKLISLSTRFFFKTLPFEVAILCKGIIYLPATFKNMSYYPYFNFSLAIWD